jgi:hypothetical protein
MWTNIFDRFQILVQQAKYTFDIPKKNIINIFMMISEISSEFSSQFTELVFLYGFVELVDLGSVRFMNFHFQDDFGKFAE